MKESFTYAGYPIDIEIEKEEGQLFAKAYCPICGGSEDSADHGFGPDHAATITKGKMRTHMRLTHKIEEPDPKKSDEREPEMPS